MATDGTTLITPLALAVTLLMGFLLLVLPRRYALVPVIILTCYMTLGQRVVIAGLDFTMIRILVMFGWARVLLRQEFRGLKLNSIDKLLLAFAVVSTVTHTLLWGTFGAMIYKFGQAYNAIGLYFMFRFLLRDREDLLRTFRQLAIFILPLAGAMIMEYATQRNIFAMFGGVPEFTAVRDGILRCQGPFAHPILAGTFGATLFPIFFALFKQKGSRILGLLGMSASAVIIVAAGSSGPIMAAGFGALALAMWPLRNHMRAVRWGIVLGLVALHLVMKAPVWFLIGRVSVFSASTAWHRANLIDKAIQNFREWWLVGTTDTAHWGYFLSDVTNQFIRVGVDGGLVPMFLFILMIARAFGSVGLSLRAAGDVPRSVQLAIWALGAALLTHVVTFFSVAYFDQNIVNFYLLLAVIAYTRNSFVPAPAPLRHWQAPTLNGAQAGNKLPGSPAETPARASGRVR
jgi:hypothetical protein